MQFYTDPVCFLCFWMISLWKISLSWWFSDMLFLNLVHFKRQDKISLPHVPSKYKKVIFSKLVRLARKGFVVTRSLNCLTAISLKANHGNLPSTVWAHPPPGCTGQTSGCRLLLLQHLSAGLHLRRLCSRPRWGAHGPRQRDRVPAGLPDELQLPPVFLGGVLSQRHRRPQEMLPPRDLREAALHQLPLLHQRAPPSRLWSVVLPGLWVGRMPGGQPRRAVRRVRPAAMSGRLQGTTGRILQLFHLHPSGRSLHALRRMSVQG